MRELRNTDDYKALYAEEAAIAEVQLLIAELMEEKGISQKELAARLGVSQSAVSQLMGLSPRNLSVRKLARVLFALEDTLFVTSASRSKRFAMESLESQCWIDPIVQESISRQKPPSPYYQVHANDDNCGFISAIDSRPWLAKTWRERAEAA